MKIALMRTNLARAGLWNRFAVSVLMDRIAEQLRVSRALNEDFFEQELLFDKYIYEMGVGYVVQDIIVCACCEVEFANTAAAVTQHLCLETHMVNKIKILQRCAMNRFQWLFYLFICINMFGCEAINDPLLGPLHVVKSFLIIVKYCNILQIYCNYCNYLLELIQ